VHAPSKAARSASTPPTPCVQGLGCVPAPLQISRLGVSPTELQLLANIWKTGKRVCPAKRLFSLAHNLASAGQTGFIWLRKWWGLLYLLKTFPERQLFPFVQAILPKLVRLLKML